MQNLLDHPFNNKMIMAKKRSIKKDLVASTECFLEKNIAILGGSSTKDIKDILEIFLLKNSIKPKFYESEYGKYWEDAVFENQPLSEFKPDIFYIHTCNRNILNFPEINSSVQDVDNMLSNEFSRYKKMWSRLRENYNCTIIQNNFEMPAYRLLGNLDSVDYRGRLNFILKLNEMFSDYANNNSDLIINDLNYLSASYGLEKWSDPQDWYMYKYSLALNAIPSLSFNICNLIKAIYGKSKKVLVLDLDNTLWGGVIGDDGQEGIELGDETALGEAYKEFQEYIKKHKDIGILLAVNSKNDLENALSGLSHPSGELKADDFLVIKANWKNKDININEIAHELNLGADSFVFIDDNIVERDIVSKSINEISVPNIDTVENYINIIDKGGYFEVLKLSEEDLVRNKTYKVNAERMNNQLDFVNYDDFLRSLNMTAEISSFKPLYVPRITQLTNKTNQFNLTTKRFSQKDIELVMEDSSYIKLYGILKDKYGDNGLTSVVIARIESQVMHIDLWLMSCRVLKRNFEFAMMDELFSSAIQNNVKTIKGYFFKTKKNNMVSMLYQDFGFEKKVSNNEDTIWELDVAKYNTLNNVIKVNN